MRNLIKLLCLVCVVIVTACGDSNVIKVKTVDEFNSAVKVVKPGQTIELANGVWNDAELLFNAIGETENPIKLSAETKGSVTLEGQSRLRIGGKHLIVEGLVFTNGYTATSEVISFKEKKGVYANNCRVTECVIDNYNSPERFKTTTWIAIYGKENRVDHCYLVDKRGSGVTMTVRMVDEACRDNNHMIDYNYFGFRQNLGSNGGETLRLGTSHYSLSECGSTVKNNYFEYCDGEHEIISNKSCGNRFEGNTFMECRGTLTYRHGNDNVAEGNFFFGNGKEHTGGIRIINKRNKAINNYFSDLKGYRFRGALVIMNGVPNSVINRYHQVDGGVFENNTFIDCDHVQLCSGSDLERSAVPINSRVENNLFYHSERNSVFTVYDDISGIEFKNNYVSNNIQDKVGSISPKKMEIVTNSNGIKQIKIDGVQAGCTLQKPTADSKVCGVSWYPKSYQSRDFDNGSVVAVKSGHNTLLDAIKNSKTGDILTLEDGGEYTMNKDCVISHPITIVSKNGAVIKSENSEMFMIDNGGALKLKGITISGDDSPDVAGNSIITTSHYSMNCNYKLIVEDCKVEDLDVNHSFDFLKVYKNTMADSISIKNTTFKNITGNVMLLNKEVEDLGIYNAEYVIIENSTFTDVQGAALNLYRGGTDESTFGPTLRVKNSSFTNVGNGKRNKSDAVIYSHGAQVCDISDIKIEGSNALELFMTNGEPITTVNSIEITNSKGLKHNDQPFECSEVTVDGKLISKAKL